MSPVTPLQYQHHWVATCPLCLKRPTGSKTIYGHPVCKKCYYAFANRRQLAYIVDALARWLVLAAVVGGAAVALRGSPNVNLPGSHPARHHVRHRFVRDEGWL